MKRNARILQIAAAWFALLFFCISCAGRNSIIVDVDPIGFFSETTVKPAPRLSAPAEDTPRPSPINQTEEPGAAPHTRSATFIACVDCIAHDAVIADALKRANEEHPNYNFYDMFAGIAPLIKAADVSYINMEGCVGGPEFGYRGYPRFNAPNEIGTTFAELGFDVVNIANNHMMDYNEEGYANTIAYFHLLPFTTIGGYTKQDYDRVRIVERNGIRIAFLSYLTRINLNNLLPESSEYLLPFALEEDITRQVGIARANADFVVVSMHWGVENITMPNEEQTRLAKLLADLGADVVVGNHTHTVLPVEWITGENGNRTLVAYSLGNCISTMHYTEYLAGAMLSLSLNMSDTGEKSVSDVRIIPIVTHYSLQRDQVALHLLSDYSEELARQHGSTLKNDFSFELLQRCYDAVSAEFMR